MFLVGKNIVYGNAQIICYFIQDKENTYLGKIVSWKTIIFAVVGTEILIGVL